PAHHHSDYLSFHTPPPPEIYPLSLHDALPICGLTIHRQDGLLHTRRHRGLAPERLEPLGEAPLKDTRFQRAQDPPKDVLSTTPRSEEHTSELQSLAYLVCRLLLEKKNIILLIQ